MMKEEDGNMKIKFFINFFRYDENFNYYNKNGEPDKSGSDMETSVEEIRKRQIFAGSEQEADDEKGYKKKNCLNLILQKR